MTDTLRERQGEYENSYNIHITKRLPIIVRVTLRNSKKLTQDIDGSFNREFSDVMANAMLYTITEIQDAIFGYHYRDQMIFVLRNDFDHDHEPWYQNNLQNICSVVSSLSSVGFHRSRELFGDEMSIVGDGVFKSKVFPLPYINEVMNYLISHQQRCMKYAVSCAANEELTDKFGAKTAEKFLANKKYEEKVDLLLHHCGIDFEDFYPSYFVRGIAAYKVPTIISTKKGGESKNKWTLNYNIPDFIDNKEFLYNILTNGVDVFRATYVSVD
jgi:tRNA(His) 5'-end guanylyltransferase